MLLIDKQGVLLYNYVVKDCNKERATMAHEFRIKSILSTLLSIPVAALLALGTYAATQAHGVESADEYPIDVQQSNQNPDASLSNDGTASLYGIFDDGDGTAENPYVISNSFQLEYLSGEINSGNRNNEYFVLANDIDMGGAEWIPMGIYSESYGYSRTFQGVFDGAGYTVSNFKITSPNQRYVGFFGFIYNGTVKNLNITNAQINVSSKDYVYAGTIAGRVISSMNMSSEISNCNVSDSLVSATSTVYSSYSGGISGFFMASGPNAKATVSNVSVTTTPVRAYSGYTTVSSAKHNTYAGGIIGYFACGNSGSQSIENAHFNGDVISSHTQSSGSLRSFSGGILGFTGFGGGAGKINISKCYSFGSCSSTSYEQSYSGGFTSYISVLDPQSAGYALTISDSFSASNCSALTSTKESGPDYTCIGGFVGETYDASKGGVITNCYVASNAVDNGSNYSYNGLFAGYNAGVTTTNCYVFDFSFTKGAEEFKDGVTKLSLEQSTNAESYVGFDFENTWEFKPSSSYSLPILKGTSPNFTNYLYTIINSEDILSSVQVSKDASLLLPTTVPTLPEDNMYSYEFSHWSLIPDGSAVENHTYTRHTNIFAVYNKTPKNYTIYFKSDGKDIVSPSVYPYGSKITLPASPTKPDDLNFWYRFSHWSLSQDGSALDADTFTVTKDQTIYAVFTSMSYDAWDGEKSTSFSRGTGTANDPYEINSGYELYYLSQQVNSGVEGYANAHYKVTSNINLGGSEWTPIGTKENPFEGTFNGGGYEIDGLKISSADTVYAGLFGYVKDASISKIQLSDVSISITGANTDLYAGALCGYVSVSSDADTGLIKSTGNINIKSDGNVYASGIIGYIDIASGASFNLSNSYSTCNVTGVSNSAISNVSGIISTITANGECSISQCYSTGLMKSEAADESNSSGVISFISGDGQVRVYGCFATGDVSSKSALPLGATSGHIAAITTENCKFEECLYLRGLKLTSTGENVAGNIKDDIGVSAPTETFRNQNTLTNSLGFDFGSTWEIVSSYTYPSLKLERSDKPKFSLKNFVKTSRAVTAELDVMSDSSEWYTVTLNVYSERGRLIGTKSIAVNNAVPKTKNVTLTVSNLSQSEQASYVTIVAFDKLTLNPLFTAITKKF